MKYTNSFRAPVIDTAEPSYRYQLAEELMYRDRELARLHKLYPVGTKVYYSSVGDVGVAAGLGIRGIIIDTSKTQLVRVLWNNDPEPEWIDCSYLSLS